MATSGQSLRLVKRRHGRRWTELLHCEPSQADQVAAVVELVLKIDPNVQFELRTIRGDVIGEAGKPDDSAGR